MSKEIYSSKDFENEERNSTFVRVQKDKICDVCGDKGLVLDLVTCSKCKRASQHMAEAIITLEDKVCEMCGTVGYAEKLVTCSHCKKTSEHIYCMNDQLFKVPKLWYCEKCLPCIVVVNGGAKNASKKQKSFHDNSNLEISKSPVTRTLDLDCKANNNHIGEGKNQNKTLDTFKKARIPAADSSPGKTSAKVSTPASSQANQDQDRSSSECKMSKQHFVGVGDKDKILQKVKDSGKKSVNISRPASSQPNQDRNSNPSRSKISMHHYVRDKDKYMQLVKDSGTKLHFDVERVRTGYHDPQACWKGMFEVFEMVHHVYSGVRCHLSSSVCTNVLKTLEHLPEKLNLSVLARKDVWPKIFELNPPTEEDAGLYFFPCELERSKEKYIRLLERLYLRDLALKARVNDVHLLLFSSNLLPMESQRIGGEAYLWGVFHHVKHKKLGQHVKVKNPSYDIRSDISKKLNVGDEENVKLDAPSSFSRLSSRDVNNVKCSFENLPSEKVDEEPIDPDIPPGYSKVRPPRFPKHLQGAAKSKNRAQSNVSCERQYDKVHIIGNKERGNSDISLTDKVNKPIDLDIPPGFLNFGPQFSKLLPEAVKSSNCDQSNVAPERVYHEVRIAGDKESGSSNILPSEKVDEPIDPDIPPGFSNFGPPRIPKFVDVAVESNNCDKSNVPPERVNDEVHIIRSKKSGSSEILPPRKVDEPIDPEIPPGFSNFGPPQIPKLVHGAAKSNNCNQSNVPPDKVYDDVHIVGEKESGNSNILPFSKVDKQIDPDIPPGFSNFGPPRFQKLLKGASKRDNCAHSNDSFERHSDEVQIVGDKEKDQRDVPILNVDTEKLNIDSVVEFPLKNVTRPVDQDVSLGLSKLCSLTVSKIPSSKNQSSSSNTLTPGKRAEHPGSPSPNQTAAVKKGPRLFVSSDNSTKSNVTSKNLPSLSAMDVVLDSSANPSSQMIEVCNDPAQLNALSVKIPEVKKKDIPVSRVITLSSSRNENLGKESSPIKFSLKKAGSAIRPNVPHCFSELELRSLPKCSSFEGKKNSPEPSFKGSHPSIMVCKDDSCQVRSKCHKTTKLSENSNNSCSPQSKKENSVMKSFTSPDGCGKLHSISEKEIVNSSSVNSSHEREHDAMCLNLESISAVKRRLLELKKTTIDKRKEEREPREDKTEEVEGVGKAEYKEKDASLSKKLSQISAAQSGIQIMQESKRKSIDELSLGGTIHDEVKGEGKIDSKNKKDSVSENCPSGSPVENELNSRNSQISFVSVFYGSPSIFTKVHKVSDNPKNDIDRNEKMESQNQLDDNRLPVAPVNTNREKENDEKKINNERNLYENFDSPSISLEPTQNVTELDSERSITIVSPELSLSRPQYVRNRDAWVSISESSKRLLDADGGGNNLRLSL